MSKEAIRKGCCFYQKWYIKGKRLVHKAEPPRRKLCRVPPGGHFSTNITGVLLQVKSSDTNPLAQDQPCRGVI